MGRPQFGSRPNLYKTAARDLYKTAGAAAKGGLARDRDRNNLLASEYTVANSQTTQLCSS